MEPSPKPSRSRQFWVEHVYSWSSSGLSHTINVGAKRAFNVNIFSTELSTNGALYSIPAPTFFLLLIYTQMLNERLLFDNIENKP